MLLLAEFDTIEFSPNSGGVSFRNPSRLGDSSRIRAMFGDDILLDLILSELVLVGFFLPSTLSLLKRIFGVDILRGLTARFLVLPMRCILPPNP